MRTRGSGSALPGQSLQEDIGTILGSITAVPAAGLRREPQGAHLGMPRIRARAAERLLLDPAGYFVVLPDRASGTIVLEHYENDGVRAHVLEGTRAEDLFATRSKMASCRVWIAGSPSSP